ncbi:MAG: tetratricopeptide repeat protein [Butyricimonas paravirosa]
MGNIYQNQQNYAAAIKEYSLAIQYAKKNGEEYELVYAYYLNRGNCYLKQREFAKAIPDYTYSLKLNKDNGAIYANRGIAYFSTGKRKEACADWRKAKSLGVTSVNAYINRYCR